MINNTKDTLPKILLYNKSAAADKIAVREKKGSTFTTYTWEQYYQAVKFAALRLVKDILSSGDRVCLIGANCTEILFLDLAIQSLSAIPANIFPDAAAANIKELINLVGASLIIVEGDNNLIKIGDIVSSCPTLKTILTIHCKDYFPGPQVRVLSYETLCKEGEVVDLEMGLDHFDNMVLKTRSNSICAITFTSGTTGSPKGVVHTQKSALSFCNALHDFSLDNGDSSMFIGFPFSAIAGRKQLQIESLKFMTEINLGSSLANFLEEIHDFPDAAVMGLPYHWDKISSRIDTAISKKNILLRSLHSLILKNKRLEQYRADPTKINIYWRSILAFADFILFRPLRRIVHLQGNKVCVSGGAFLKFSTQRNLFLQGIFVHEAYGLSELGSAIAVQTKKGPRFGNVGKPLPGAEIKIAADGEILVKSAGLFSGYYGDDDLYKQVVRDGWYHTGDLGQVDEIGELWVSGRKKDIIITASGQKINPAEIESEIKKCPLVEEALVIGEQRKFLVALIFVGQTKLPTTLDLNNLLEKEISAINARLPYTKNIKKYEIIILDEVVFKKEVFATSMKLPRKALEHKYNDCIQRLYTQN